MNLHDPQRPKISHRPAFTTGWQIIPRLQLWPLENDEVELSLMLPVQDQRFAGKWYNITVNQYEVPDLLKEFRNSPEEFVRLYFGLDINNLKSEPKASKASVEKQIKTILSGDQKAIMDLI
jgi:hypothetical protein